MERRPSTKMRPIHDEAVRQALIVFHEASDRLRGKRLKPLLPHGQLQTLWQRVAKWREDEARRLVFSFGPVRTRVVDRGAYSTIASAVIPSSVLLIARTPFTS